MADELRGDDIGHGVHIRYVGKYGEPADVRVGLVVAHRHQDGSVCEGVIHFAIPATDDLPTDAPRWTVVNWEPLTLSPSIHNPPCGLHGYITAGCWIPA